MTHAMDETVGSTLEVEDARLDVRMHEGIASEWELWSMIIGKTALPRLEQLRRNLPTMISATLTTADGLNLCSIGIHPDDVGRLAALNSSLFAVSAAQTELVCGDEASPDHTYVQLVSGDTQMVMVSLVQQPLGHLLLFVTARDVPLASVVVSARAAADDLRAWIGSAA